MTKTAAEMVGEARARVATVSPKDASLEGVSEGVVFLDVREPVEWEHHIEGAVQVPRGLLEFAADPASPKHKPELDPDGRVIVYCRSGSARRLPAPRSWTWATPMSPTSRADSAPGRRPACPPTSTMTGSDRPARR